MGISAKLMNYVKHAEHEHGVHKIPNSKHQIPNKSQIPNTKKSERFSPDASGECSFFKIIYRFVIWDFVHDDISLIPSVIPGLTKPAPYLIRGNPGFFWIPAFAGMTRYALINIAMYSHWHLPALLNKS
jgi:hypothetical protein